MLGVILLLTALGVIAGSAMSTQRGNCPAGQSEKSKADRSRGRATPGPHDAERPFIRDA